MVEIGGHMSKTIRMKRISANKKEEIVLRKKPVF